MLGAHYKKLSALLIGAIGACSSPAQTPLPTEATAPSPTAAHSPATEPTRPIHITKTPQVIGGPPPQYAQFDAYLSTALGRPVQMVGASTYEGAVTEIVEGRSEFALLSPLAYVRAKERLPGLKLLATMVRDGQTRYRSYIIASVGAGIDRLSDLKGQRIVLGDQNSTSAYLFPSMLLRDAGLSLTHDFSEVERIASHHEIMRRVANREADAGAVSSSTFHVTSGSWEGKIKIIAKSDWIPYDALAAHPTVAPALAEQLRAAILTLNTRTKEGRSILGDLPMVNGFVPGDDTPYETIRKMEKRFKKSTADSP